MESDFQVFWYQGDYLPSQEWRILSPLLLGNSRNRWDALWWQRRQTEVWGRIWRLYGAVEWGLIEVAAGRMRNAFGQGRLFLSPLDRIDSLPSLVSESWERPGSETLFLRGSFSDAWRWKSGYIWGRGPQEDRGYVHSQFFIREGWEMEMLLARSWPRTQSAGVGLDYSLWQGQLRWQGTYNKSKEDRLVVDTSGFPPVLQTQTNSFSFWHHLISWERAMGQDGVLAWEYFHNGRGESDPTRYDLTRLLGGQDLYLARDYAGVYWQRRLTPLWSCSFQGVVGLTDRGAAGTPEVVFLSADSSWEAKLWSSFYFGSSESEFGQLKNRTQLAVSFYF